MSNALWSFGAIALVVILAYLIFVIYVYLEQAKMVFIPSGEIEATPENVGLAYKNVFFTTKDNIKLNGWFIAIEKAQGVTLFCHGNGGNISHRLETIQLLNRLNLSVFIFDYRGYGLSEGKPSEKGTYRDAEAAWNYLVEILKIPEEDIIIMGRSLGGAIASYLAKKYNPGALIVESAFTSVGDLGSEIYPYLPIRLLSRFKYPTIEYVTDVNCPIMVIHSKDDDIVPFHHGQRIYDVVNEPKRFMEISGGHNEGFSSDGNSYIDGLQSFIEECDNIIVKG